MKVKSESEVAQSYLTLSDPMDCSLPGSSIHRIFQARVLEWGAIAFFEIPYRLSLKLSREKGTANKLSEPRGDQGHLMTKCKMRSRTLGKNWRTTDLKYELSILTNVSIL